MKKGLLGFSITFSLAWCSMCAYAVAQTGVYSNPLHDNARESGQEKKSKRVLLHKTTYGDNMGDVSMDKDMKRSDYYYNTDGLLVRVVDLGRGYGNDDSYQKTSLTKNDYDERGRLVKSTHYQFGLYDHGDMSSVISLQETYAYGENGLLKTYSDGTSSYEYEYDEEGNKIKETYWRPSTCDTIQVLEYAEFVGKDKPGLVKASSPKHPDWTGLFYNEVRNYDNDGNLVRAERSRKGEGGTVEHILLKTWEYEGDLMVRNIEYSYNDFGKTVPVRMSVNKLKDGNPNLIVHSDSTYYKNKWYLSNTIYVEEYSNFEDGESYAMNLSAEASRDALNTTVLVMDIPAVASTPDCYIRIFRDGDVIVSKPVMELVSTDSSGNRCLTYTDSTLANGDYDYFALACIRQVDEGGTENYAGCCISNPVGMSYRLELPKVAGLHLATARKDKSGDYYGTLSWTNPVNREMYGFVSNGLYFDNMQISEADTSDIEATSLEAAFINKKTKAYVLTHYKYGKASSDTIEVAKADLKEIVAGVDEVTGNGTAVRLAGKSLSVDTQADITVYSADGKVALRASGVYTVDLGRFAAGIYFVSIGQNGNVTAYKICLR